MNTKLNDRDTFNYLDNHLGTKLKGNIDNKNTINEQIQGLKGLNYNGGLHI